MHFDIVIAGGGPAGLSAALALGRARKRVLVCDAGGRRNAAAEHVHNFVTRDGITPAAFRAVGREQLGAYPQVVIRDEAVQAIRGERGAFEVRLSGQTVTARRVLLCTGLIDEMLQVPGFRELWGRSIFQCPYCHGWELRDLRWAYLATSVEPLQHFPGVLRGWTRHVTVLTDGKLEVPQALRERFHATGVQLETRPILQLVAADGRLRHIELAGGEPLACDALFAHPPQQQVPFVRELGLALDAYGSVQADPMTRETSIPGIYAAGDLATRMQAAVFAAAAGMQAAAALNHELSAELAADEVAAGG